MPETVVILGGGVGGVVTANELRKALPKAHRIVLVEREASFVFAPSLLWLMTGGRTAEKISRPLARLAKKGIEVVQGEIQRIDAARREVTVDGRSLAGHDLVIALGAELAPETIPGLAEAGHHDFYTLAGAEALRDHLKSFSGGRIVILTAAPAYKCPAAPYEAAMLLEHNCRKRHIRENTQIDLFAAEPGPMGVAGPEVSKAVRQMVEAKGIAYHPEHQVKEVDPISRILRFTNGVETPYDVLAYVPPHRAPRVVRESGLVSESGWISVDPSTLATTFPGVYAIGDVVSIPLALGKPLPKAGVFAHYEAKVVAQNVARAITGKGKPASFDGEGECFVETGDGKAGFGKGNFYAKPVPQVKLHAPSRHWHGAKILFEKDSLRRWFWRNEHIRADYRVERTTVLVRRQCRWTMPKTVVLFSQPGWMFCARVKEFLRKNNIAFTDRDITSDESALAELEKLGVMTTPVTVVDGQAVIGYDVNKLKALLDV